MSQGHGVSRRGFLAGASATAAGLGAAACSPYSFRQKTHDEVADEVSTRLTRATVAFDAEHQAGVQTASQAHAAVLAFTVRPGCGLKDMRRLFRLWTEDARRLASGHAPLGDLEKELVHIPANLTFTAGVGERFFDIIDKPHLRPSWLHPIPPFHHDRLDPKWGEADIVVQVCCDDNVTLTHAVRHIVRSGADYVALRWNQQGFSNADGTMKDGTTPRNLFGQIDGTVNPHTSAEYNDQVWIKDGPAWQRGGTCMVIRRIAMHIDTWEKLDRASREVVIGRRLTDGAPLTGGSEFTPADFNATDSLGLPVIDPASHMARSHPPADHPHQKLLRRPFSYDMPPEPGSEELSNSGLLFICFQQNPDKQFTAIQRRLDSGDRLNQWITHIGSAVFFIFPGTTPNTYWGSRLLEDAR